MLHIKLPRCITWVHCLSLVQNIGGNWVLPTPWKTAQPALHYGVYHKLPLEIYEEKETGYRVSNAFISYISGGKGLTLLSLAGKRTVDGQSFWKLNSHNAQHAAPLELQHAPRIVYKCASADGFVLKSQSWMQKAATALELILHGTFTVTSTISHNPGKLARSFPTRKKGGMLPVFQTTIPCLLNYASIVIMSRLQYAMSK